MKKCDLCGECYENAENGHPKYFCSQEDQAETNWIESFET